MPEARSSTTLHLSSVKVDPENRMVPPAAKSALSATSTAPTYCLSVMSIPGLLLPGLTHLSAPPDRPSTPRTQVPRLQTLEGSAEFRFEVPFSKRVTVKLLTGEAEIFGQELAPSHTYTFSGTKAAVFSWHGCCLEITGECESEYVAEETPMISYANLHFALENLRQAAKETGDVGPRVMVVGPSNAGKTSLIKILTAYAVRSGRQPVVVNLDPRQGMLSVPGSLTATTVASALDVEEGWGSSPISGPSAVPIKMPLVYYLGTGSAEEGGRVFRPLVTRMALAVTSRLEEDDGARESGCFIDTEGGMSAGKGSGYGDIWHIVSEFSVNVLLVLGSERLYSDMSRHFSSQTGDDAVTVLKLPKSGGCVDRDEAYMKQLRQSQIRNYFFGRQPNVLNPSSQVVDFGQLNIYKMVEISPSSNPSFLPGGDDDDNSTFGLAIYEKVQPSLMMQNCLLTVTYADPNDSQENIRDSSVMGYVYVADVDDAKKTVRLLAPTSGRIPTRALIWGSWPEDVADLVG